MPYQPYDYKTKSENPEEDLNRILAGTECRISRSERNKTARAAGKAFESMIKRACEAYRTIDRAMVTKVPEARQVIGRTGDRRSKMICVNARKAHPDFMGSVAPHGRTIVFDAKHTAKERMLKTALTWQQSVIMDEHLKCGAWCFVAVSFSFRDFFLVPYSFWRDMKQHVGRNYLLATDPDIQKFRLPFDRDMNDRGNAYVWFLGRPDDLSGIFKKPTEPLIDPETGEEIDPESMVFV